MSYLWNLAKNGIVLIAIAIIAVVVVYFLNPVAALDLLGRNPYLSNGILMAGAAGFAWATLRIRLPMFKLESWWALLEGVCGAGFICAYIIYREGNLYWVIPGWLALLAALLCFFLRFLDPRRKRNEAEIVRKQSQ